MTLAENLGKIGDRGLVLSPEQSAANRESIIRWLLGKDLERFYLLNQTQLEITKQAMEYRYRILCQRYLGLAPEGAHLMQRLGSLVLLRNKIRSC